MSTSERPERMSTGDPLSFHRVDVFSDEPASPTWSRTRRGRWGSGDRSRRSAKASCASPNVTGMEPTTSPALVRLERTAGETGGHVADVVLDRPEALNAISTALARALGDVFTELAADDDLRAVVVSSSSPRAFCVGADLKERDGYSDEQLRGQRVVYRRMASAILACPVPVVAAVAGYALGGGLELALLGDLVVADETAVVGLPEVSVGVIPGLGGTQLLPRRIGAARAADLVYTARRLDAAEALALGVVDRVVPAGGAVTAARETAGSIARNSPVAVRNAKRALRLGAGGDLAAALDIEDGAWRATAFSADRAEGVRAFTEKRAPRWPRRPRPDRPDAPDPAGPDETGAPGGGGRPPPMPTRLSSRTRRVGYGCCCSRSSAADRIQAHPEQGAGPQGPRRRGDGSEHDRSRTRGGGVRTSATVRARAGPSNRVGRGSGSRVEQAGGSAGRAGLPVVRRSETAVETEALRGGAGAGQPPLLERHRQLLVLGGQGPPDGVPGGLRVLRQRLGFGVLGAVPALRVDELREDERPVGPEPEQRAQADADQIAGQVVGELRGEAEEVVRDGQAEHGDAGGDHVHEHERQELAGTRRLPAVPERPVAVAQPGDHGRGARRDHLGQLLVAVERAAAGADPEVRGEQVEQPDVDDEGDGPDRAELEHLAVDDVQSPAQP